MRNYDHTTAICTPKPSKIHSGKNGDRPLPLGGFSPLKNDGRLVSWEEIPNISGKTKLMFQTTNQIKFGGTRFLDKAK